MDAITSATLRQLPIGPALARVATAALAAVEPGFAVRQALHTQPMHQQHIRVVAVGKASVPMALAAIESLGDAIVDGIIVTKQGYLTPETPIDARLRVLEAGHPVADEHSLHAGEMIAQFLASTTADECILLLLSGGGSALMTLPVDGVTLTDMQQLIQLLLACGAPITDINTLRKHLDGLKGGGLARLARVDASHVCPC